MELANYLKYLLYNHDSVAIPGLGTLHTHYRHAEINQSDKIISPPSKYLTFELQVKKTDSLLVNYISSVNKTDKKTASQKLKELVNDLLQKLDSGETVLLEGIGYFSKIEGVIRFEKEPDINFLTDSFGLSKIDFTPVEIEFTPHANPVVHYKKQRNYTTLILFLILGIILAGSLIVYLGYPQLLNFTKKSLPAAKLQNSDSTNTKISKTAKDTTRKTDIEDFFESTTDKKNALAIPSNEVKQVPENMKYYIIAGSFKTQRKAEELAKEIEKDGFKLKIIHFEGNKIRISLGEYYNLDSALIELNKIRNAKGDNTVWLLKEKL